MQCQMLKIDFVGTQKKGQQSTLVHEGGGRKSKHMARASLLNMA